MLENVLELDTPYLIKQMKISDMVQKYLLAIVVGSLLSQSIFASPIFRSEDHQGNVTYSDAATAGSKPLNMPVETRRHLRQVKRVYDGDTIVLETGERVRLLGINTPEVESRHRANEPGGIAAKEWLQEQLKDKKVFLEYGQEKQDKYKRLLAHLFLPDGKHLNVALVENGLAAVNIMPPNLRYTDKLIQAQQQAEQQKLGIWSMPRYQLRPLAKISENHKGWQRFVGTPKSIKRSRKYSRLIFNKQINIRVANDNLELFPTLESFLGKSIEIRGWASRSKNNYSILIYHPSALIVK